MCIKRNESYQSPSVFFFFPLSSGVSTHEIPHYHKLCGRVSRVWGNLRGQHIPNVMDKPCPGKTAFVITVSPLPGKYTEDCHKPGHCHRLYKHCLHCILQQTQIVFIHNKKLGCGDVCHCREPCSELGAQPPEPMISDPMPSAEWWPVTAFVTMVLRQ